MVGQSVYHGSACLLCHVIHAAKYPGRRIGLLFVGDKKQEYAYKRAAHRYCDFVSHSECWAGKATIID